MSYTSFLVDRFDTTQENIFFRELDQHLRERFKDEANNYILIGNISIQGHRVDAILIKTGGILVIDFKNYQGELTFTENGVWRVKTNDNKVVFVQGGAIARNPLQQVTIYRRALIDFLSNNQDKILDKNHDNIDWSHISSVILFQRSVNFTRESIPVKTQYYFHIADIRSYADLFESINSMKLVLSKEELSRLLNVLNIDEAKTYQTTDIIIEDNIKKEKYDVNVMQRIKKILTPLGNLTSTQKGILFYRTMIAIERLNESDLSDVSYYPLSDNSVTENIQIDLSINSNFFTTYTKNSFERFPKNLFVALTVLIEGNKYPLFYRIYEKNEVIDSKIVKIDFNSFSIFPSTFQKLELAEDIIELLNTEISELTNLVDKLDRISNVLGIQLEFLSELTVGLSSESIYTAQLLSELKMMLSKDVKEPSKGTILSNILSNNPVISTKNSPLEHIVQVTSLNKSQLKAVQLAFTEPLSIITGPPGTGKSQVVVNIMANAVLNNQKVLFASKNNQAVNNVNQRLCEHLESDYFLRLGGNEFNVIAKDVISKISNDIANDYYKSDSENFFQNKVRCYAVSDELRELNFKIDQIPILKEEIESLDVSLKDVQFLYEQWEKTIEPKEKDLFLKKKKIIKVNNSEVNRLLNELHSVKGVLSKIIFSLFKKNKIQSYIIELNKSFDESIQNYIDNQAPYFQEGISTIESFSKNVEFIKNLNERQKVINNQFKEFSTKIESIKKVLFDKRNLLELYQKEEVVNINKIKDLQPQYVKYSRELVKSSIANNLHGIKGNNQAIHALEMYKSYLINGMPWKRDLLKECAQNTQMFQSVFKGISISNLTIKKAFPLQEEIFDLVIIDEASQCDISSVIPLLYRAKRVCILGDPLQLKHITSVNRGEQQFVLDELQLDINQFNYEGASLFDKMNSICLTNQFDSAFLNEHYRCHPEIIGFCNEYFYIPKAGQSLVIKTESSSFKFGESGFNWINVVGKGNDKRNVNLEEVEVCVYLVLRLRKEHPNASIGVATPFRHQKEALQNAFKNLDNEFKANLIVDTVHRFQGSESDIMLFSLVLGAGYKASLSRFINYSSPFLLNVAVSRAKSSLYIIGDKSFCKSLVGTWGEKTLLSNLANYSDSLNKNESYGSIKPVINKEATPDNKQHNNSIPVFNSLVEFIEYCISNDKIINIKYQNGKGEISNRCLSNIEFSEEYVGINDSKAYIRAFCFSRQELRTFKMSNILDAYIQS
ncbi:AAA domain-containing protein [Myroides marinus]|uniref:AAA domain-containing protein n=1 Tax=Myroides marinus TaxID=703342 RepID=UPI002578814F|nr:AAA domain-containing protein [Myroides marinus]MDM1363199.1 AAA family ATPase [Myroides marinus]MDM1372731.1 AAA family ATPase [Myroides marinus]